MEIPCLTSPVCFLIGIQSEDIIQIGEAILIVWRGEGVHIHGLSNFEDVCACKVQPPVDMCKITAKYRFFYLGSGMKDSMASVPAAQEY